MKHWRYVALLAVAAALNGCAGDIDETDYCPDDPDKVVPGVCGCGVPDADENENGIADCLEEGKVVLGEDEYSKLEEAAKPIDLCPNDPDKDHPGICGCGVSDEIDPKTGVAACLNESIDLCPDDDEKKLPGICGCGVSDIDTDEDGVPDCLDECSEDANKVTAGACGCGVEEKASDSDLDGVIDCLDACPYDPELWEEGSKCHYGVDNNEIVFQIWTAEDAQAFFNKAKKDNPLPRADMMCSFDNKRVLDDYCLDSNTAVKCEPNETSILFQYGVVKVENCANGCSMENGVARCDVEVVCKKPESGKDPSEEGDCCSAAFRGMCNADGSALVCENGVVVKKTCSDGCFAGSPGTSMDANIGGGVICLDKQDTTLHAVLMADIDLGELYDILSTADEDGYDPENDPEICWADNWEPVDMYGVLLEGNGHTVSFTDGKGKRCVAIAPLFNNVVQSRVTNVNFDFDSYLVDEEDSIYAVEGMLSGFAKHMRKSKLDGVSFNGSIQSDENGAVILASVADLIALKDVKLAYDVRVDKYFYGLTLYGSNIVLDGLNLNYGKAWIGSDSVALVPISLNSYVNDVHVTYDDLSVGGEFYGMGFWTAGRYQDVSLTINKLSLLGSGRSFSVLGFGGAGEFWVDGFTFKLSNAILNSDKNEVHISGVSQQMNGYFKDVTIDFSNIETRGTIYGITSNLSGAQLVNATVKLDTVSSDKSIVGLAESVEAPKAVDEKGAVVIGENDQPLYAYAPVEGFSVEMKNVKSAQDINAVATDFGFAGMVNLESSKISVSIDGAEGGRLFGLAKSVWGKLSDIQLNINDVHIKDVAHFFVEYDNADVKDVTLTADKVKSNGIYGFSREYNETAVSQNITLQEGNLSADDVYVGFVEYCRGGKIDNVSITTKSAEANGPDGALVSFVAVAEKNSEISNITVDADRLTTTGYNYAFMAVLGNSIVDNVRVNVKEMLSPAGTIVGGIADIDGSKLSNASILVDHAVGSEAYFISNLGNSSEVRNGAFYGNFYVTEPSKDEISGFSVRLAGKLNNVMTASRMFVATYDAAADTVSVKDEIKSVIVAGVVESTAGVDKVFWLNRNGDGLACKEASNAEILFTPFNMGDVDDLVGKLNAGLDDQKDQTWKTLDIEEDGNPLTLPWLAQK